ncbi:hypothetical protein LXA43DRAFT_296575 [Ganoderma leucocontextum]|nr:hypothetical protein LXA43DRAFT_296575 [Ganoderma leucocontextum]
MNGLSFWRYTPPPLSSWPRGCRLGFWFGHRRGAPLDSPCLRTLGRIGALSMFRSKPFQHFRQPLVVWTTGHSSFFYPHTPHHLLFLRLRAARDLPYGFTHAPTGNDPFVAPLPLRQLIVSIGLCCSCSVMSVIGYCTASRVHPHTRYCTRSSTVMAVHDWLGRFSLHWVSFIASPHTTFDTKPSSASSLRRPLICPLALFLILSLPTVSSTAHTSTHAHVHASYIVSIHHLVHRYTVT